MTTGAWLRSKILERLRKAARDVESGRHAQALHELHMARLWARHTTGSDHVTASQALYVLDEVEARMKR